MQVVRSRLQDQRGPGGYSGVVDAVMRTVRLEGAAALYKGFTLNLVRTLPACAITFSSYELVMRHFHA